MIEIWNILVKQRFLIDRKHNQHQSWQPMIWTIFYHPKSTNGKPNVLSRYSEYHPKQGGDSIDETQNQPIHQAA
jgi:hypothetical protein